ncbi:MAG: hypothetical protein DWQ07_02030 [Chloroflexi bacterium]|nr:MAG: hypothetical protein DWQ07_02030 [Chloroflexota bacterium]MBL1193723.1 hypothetical protein [Chloroflexota bacterium]NOH11016.1 hypothetical protein [Chloroflexota bacterium]
MNDSETLASRIGAANYYDWLKPIADKFNETPEQRWEILKEWAIVTEGRPFSGKLGDSYCAEFLRENAPSYLVTPV